MSRQSSIEKGMEGTGCPLLSTPVDSLPGNRVDAARVGGAGGRVSVLPPPIPPRMYTPPRAVPGAGDVPGLVGGRHSDLNSSNHPSDTPSTSSV